MLYMSIVLTGELSDHNVRFIVMSYFNLVMSLYTKMSLLFYKESTMITEKYGLIYVNYNEMHCCVLNKCIN